MADFADQINAGVEWLDSTYGRDGWLSQIDLDQLHLGSCSKCILGQLEGDFNEAVDSLNLDDVDGFGFDLPDSHTFPNCTSNEANANYNQLTDQWIQTITDLRLDGA